VAVAVELKIQTLQQEVLVAVVVIKAMEHLELLVKETLAVMVLVLILQQQAVAVAVQMPLQELVAMVLVLMAVLAVMAHLHQLLVLP
jgi:hypothetical protein